MGLRKRLAIHLQRCELRTNAGRVQPLRGHPRPPKPADHSLDRHPHRPPGEPGRPRRDPLQPAEHDRWKISHVQPGLCGSRLGTLSTGRGRRRPPDYGLLLQLRHSLATGYVVPIPCFSCRRFDY